MLFFKKFTIFTPSLRHFGFHIMCFSVKKSECFIFFFFYKAFYSNLLFIYIFICFYIYFWLCWVFVSVQGLSLVAASGGHSSSRWTGLSLSWPLLLRSTGSRCAGSVVVAHGPSHSTARGIFPDQGLNPCPLHWQADSQPLRHQGSPIFLYFGEDFLIGISIPEYVLVIAAVTSEHTLNET